MDSASAPVSVKTSSQNDGVTRRNILHSAVGVTAVVGAVAAAAPAAAMNGNGHPIFGGNRNVRSAESKNLRNLAATSNHNNFIAVQETNGDEGLYNDYRASFSKSLPHDAMGEVNRNAYRAYLSALASGGNASFETIPLANGAVRKLANPQGAYKFELSGRDSHSTWLRPAPTFAGAETAAEMGEVFWKALCRDVPFADYPWSNKISKAAADLNAFSATVGPKDGGSVTPGTIFRGETPGDLVGPYISQFLWKPIPFGPKTIEQRYAVGTPNVNFMTDVGNWLNVQRGRAPAETLVLGAERYINDGRALGDYVHNDFSYQAYLNAALILLGMPGSLDVNNLYNTSATQGGFVSLGGPDVLNLVAKAAELSLTGAWYQKWLVHRRLRPEVYAGRLHFQKTGQKNYGLPSEIGDSAAAGRIFNRYGTYLLPMAFAEGSPTHPSYPAGHATIAGACATVLKAFFQESMPIANPVESDALGSTLLPYAGTLTIGGEINKLANNIALGRDWAGVHYRSDGVDGLLVGEQQAIDLLRDYSLTYNEDFASFTLTKFNGVRIRIENGQILPA